MSRFEERGVGFQLKAETSYEAKRSFEQSCKHCCYRGMHIDCDRCAIRAVHEKMLAILDPQPVIRVRVSI